MPAQRKNGPANRAGGPAAGLRLPGTGPAVAPLSMPPNNLDGPPIMSPIRSPMMFGNSMDGAPRPHMQQGMPPNQQYGMPMPQSPMGPSPMGPNNMSQQFHPGSMHPTPSNYPQNPNYSYQSMGNPHGAGPPGGHPVASMQSGPYRPSHPGHPMMSTANGLNYSNAPMSVPAGPMMGHNYQGPMGGPGQPPGSMPSNCPGPDGQMPNSMGPGGMGSGMGMSMGMPYGQYAPNSMMGGPNGSTSGPGMSHGSMIYSGGSSNGNMNDMNGQFSQGPNASMNCGPGGMPNFTMSSLNGPMGGPNVTIGAPNTQMGNSGPMMQGSMGPGSMGPPMNPPGPVGKVYPPDQPMVFNPSNPHAPPIYPCGICHKEVHDTDEAILCESGCNFWFHRICTGLNPQAYKLLTSEVYAEWVCDKCLSSKQIPLVKLKA